MKVLLTGATGFIGAHVARKLLQGGHTVATVNQPGSSTWRIVDIENQLSCLQADLSETDKVNAFISNWQPEACIHLAWYAEPGQYLHSLKNLEALQNSLRLLQSLIASGCLQVVMAGTCAEYDLSGNSLLREDAPLHPDTIYAASKLSLAILGEQLTKQTATRFVWARLFYLYGPFEDPRRLVPALILALQADKQFASTAGEQIRDYLHVEDVANAFVRLAEQPAEGIYNICSSEPVTVKSLLARGAEILKRPDLLQLGVLPYRPWEPMYVCGDNAHLRALGWQPQYDLIQGLKITCAWWRAQTSGDKRNSTWSK